MTEGLLSFAFLGFAFGVIFDFLTVISKIRPLRWLSFLLDFSVTVLFSAAFACAMIAYADGMFRWYYLFCFGIAFVFYMLTLHRLLKKAWQGVFRTLSTVTKKLKKRKKS